MLSGATLVVLETGQSTLSDFDGSYKLNDLCQGQNYSVKVTHAACETMTFKLKVSRNLNRDFKLEHHIEELNEIIVSGKAYENQSSSVFENKCPLKF